MWPALPYDKWKDTYQTLHMWTQIVGKVALKLSPLFNHWWECSFRITPSGLRTTVIPYKEYSLEISFNFIEHTLVILKSDGTKRVMALSHKSVAAFYYEFMDCLNSLGILVEIDPVPSEVPGPIPFYEDHSHSTYDREYAFRHWQILCETEKILTQFRSHFIGKGGPVQFWWGTFDLAVSLFSGRRAPERPGVDNITKEAYSHELMGFGFWPGSGNILAPAFYSYIAPEPDGFKKGVISPQVAFYNEPTKGYILMYDDVRLLGNPQQAVFDFFKSVYNVGADLAQWDRPALERSYSDRPTSVHGKTQAFLYN